MEIELMITINFIGCGNLGRTLGRLITTYRLGTIKGILTTSLKTGDEAARFIGGGKSYPRLSELPEADIYMITTCDDIIQATCNQLIADSKIRKGSIFIHCSGSLTSDIFAKARDIDCYAMSVHPLKSFADPKLSVENFPGTYCGYEGDRTIFPLINSLFSGMGAILFPIKKELKTIYHAAGVIANNYLISLHYLASECYQLAEVHEDTAHKVTSMLMKDALQNLHEAGHKKALTGPLQRGDITIIKKHLSSLTNLSHIKKIYSALAEVIIPLTEHEKELKEKLAKLFQEEAGPNQN